MSSRLGWIKSTASSNNHKRSTSSTSSLSYQQPSGSSSSSFKDDKARIAEYQVLYHALLAQVHKHSSYQLAPLNRLLKISARYASLTDTSTQSFACSFRLRVITRCTSSPSILQATRVPVLMVVFFRCESCIERLFTLGPAPCPTCSVVLRKSGFKIQTFEDLKVEEEVAVRRRIAKQFVVILPPLLLLPNLTLAFG